MSSDRYAGVVIELTVGVMALNSTNIDIGVGGGKINIEYTGECKTVGFNVNYLIDTVSFITTDKTDHTR